jgi:xylulokinase
VNSVHLLGVDIGTSGLKCVLIDEVGQLRASAFREYTPDLPQPGWAEQDPNVWLHAAISAVREVIQISGVDRHSIAGLSFSGQMHSTVFLDRDRQVICPAILWLDTRSTPQVAALNHSIGRSQLASWIGNPVMPGFMLSSLLLTKEEEPEAWKRLAHVLLAKDYVRLRLTGEIAADFSDASSTAMLDVQQRTWCGDLLRAMGISLDLLPPLRSSSDVVGRLLPDMAEAMNLPADLSVICGAGDQEAQAIGNGIIRSGLLSSTIGTGGQLFTPIDRYRSDLQLRIHTFCHALPNWWHWQAAAFGAALLAGVGAGVFDDVAQACDRCVKWSAEAVEPRAEMTQVYREQVERWRGLPLF